MKFAAYIIGIPGRYRGVELQRQLESIGVPFARTDGVTVLWRDRPVERFVDQVSAKHCFGRELTRSEVGCALAHLDCYTQFLKTSSLWALILEDDARATTEDELCVKVSSILENEGVLEDSQRPQVISLYSRGVLAVRSSVRSIEIDGSTLSECLLPPKTTTAYLINRPAAILLSAMVPPVVSPADWPLRSLGEISHKVVLPHLFVPAVAVGSTIGSARFGSDRNVVATLVRGLLGISHVEWIVAHRFYSGYSNYLRVRVCGPLSRRLSPNRPYLLSSEVTVPPMSSRISDLLMCRRHGRGAKPV